MYVLLVARRSFQSSPMPEQIDIVSMAVQGVTLTRINKKATERQTVVLRNFKTS